MRNRNKMIMLVVAGAVIIIGGYFILKGEQVKKAREYVTNITQGLGGRGMAMIGSWAGAIPFLSKEESKKAVSSMKAQKSPVPPHSAPIYAAKPDIQTMYAKRDTRRGGSGRRDPKTGDRRSVTAGKSYTQKGVMRRISGRSTPPKLRSRAKRRTTRTGATRRAMYRSLR